MSFLDAAFIVQGHLQADFSPARMKRTMKFVGQDLRKNARRLVARRAVSAPGGFPGKVTGDLQKSVKARISRSGWSVKVASYRTDAMKAKNAFYPAYLIHGTKNGVAPRGDYITATYRSRLDWARGAISSSLLDGVDLK